MKYKIILFLLCKLSVSTAQVPTPEWSKNFIADEYDECFSVIATNDGGFIAAGHSNSPASGDKSQGNTLPIIYQNSRYDIWIIKFNALGEKVWDKTIGGNNNEFEPKIIQTNDNGFLIACISYSHISGQKTSNNVGGSDFWILKYDENGNKLWDKTIGATGTDFYPQIVQTNDGYLICGQSNSNASGSKSSNSYNNSNDIWLIKINSNGIRQWDKTIGGIGNETKPAISVNNLGEIILGASSNSNISGNKTENAIGGLDIWVMKLSAAGIMIWEKTIGTEDDEYLGGVIVDSENNIVLVASSGASGYSHNTILIKKMNTIGQVIWEREINKPTYFPKIIENKNGGYLILACLEGYLVNLDKDGLEKWNISIYNNLTVNFAQNNLGDILIVGNYYFDYALSKFSFPPVLPIINILNNDESVKKGNLLKVNFKATTDI